MLCLVQPSEGWGSSTAPDRSRCEGWNPGALFLQLQDGGDWPQQEEQRGQAPFPCQLKAPVEQGCPPRLDWELEQIPSCCSWLSYKAELPGKCTFCAANPFSRGHLSQVSRCPAPDTLKGRCGCLDSGTQPPCATSPSPAPVCEFFLVLVRGFFFRREARHTKYLWKELKVFYSTCTFIREKTILKNSHVPCYAWPKSFSAVPSFCETRSPKYVKFWTWNMNIDEPIHEL